MVRVNVKNCDISTREWQWCQLHIFFQYCLCLIGNTNVASFFLLQEYNSWWTPKSVASFNARLHFVWCHVQVMSRMAFGVLMIFAMAYLLFQRSTTSLQTMPITFVLLLLGFACGYCGKICIDTLGGSGYLWLLYWEILCLLHFLSIVCSSILFPILHGPVIAPHASKGNMIISYWIRRLLFYAILVVFLPLSCGLTPFASIGQWKDHFVVKLTEYWQI